MSNNQQRQANEIVVILPDVRSVLNVGSIFRTSDALGVSCVYLCGYTPTPIDRFGRERMDLHKAALGAEKSVSWKYVASVGDCITELKKDGFTIVAVEQDSRSIDYKDLEIKNKMAFIFGNEVEGVALDILDMCDSIAEIPMAGSKESLNIAVSFGVAMFRFLDR